MNKILLTCKRATELIELDQEGKLNPIQKIQLKMHNELCKICKVYQAQSKNMNKLLKARFDKKGIAESNPQLQEKIIAKINSEQS